MGVAATLPELSEWTLSENIKFHKKIDTNKTRSVLANSLKIINFLENSRRLFGNF